ncbi:MAG: SAF domain-containing protein [Anaerolineales bacterium]
MSKKKLVASRDLPEGHALTEADIAIDRPGDGLPPYEFENLLGKTLKRPLAQDDDIFVRGLEMIPDKSPTG